MLIGSNQFNANNSSPLSLSKSASTTCASLLRELQELWDEIGETDAERDKMLFQLEQECLDIYGRKVERTRKCKSDLQQSLVESEVEIAQLDSALDEHASLPQTLEEFTISRQEKEDDKCRFQGQKKLQEQLATEQEALFGSKPTIKKPLAHSPYANTVASIPNSHRFGPLHLVLELVAKIGETPSMSKYVDTRRSDLAATDCLYSS